MNRTEADVLVLVVEDYSGRKILKLKVPINDEKGIKQLFQLIIDKYSLNIKFVEEFKW